MPEVAFAKVVDATLEPDRVRAALEAVNSSDFLANSERLKSFLTYVVEEAIAGRAQSILGKTIAQDIYLRSGTDINVVRVDAGRLRRKLEGYYETVGAQDLTRIHIELGGYAPWFEDFSPHVGVQNQPAGQRRKWSTVLLSLGAATSVALIMALAYIAYPRGTPEPDLTQSLRVAERQALASKSRATVQAANLCDQARGHLFPIASIDGQKLATATFLQASKIDPEYVCGYAGAAHSLATSAMLTAPGSARDLLLNEAVFLSEKAVDMDPKDGWSQSAAAWSSYAAGDVEKALDRSALAEKLRPVDGNILDFRGLILIVTGHFDEAYAVTDPLRPRELGSYRFAHRNLHAVASFHLGEYRTAISSLNQATESGDPVSVLTLIYLSASYQGAGETASAQKLIRELQHSWPSFNPEAVLNALYSDPNYTAEVVKQLKDAGWEKP